MKVLERIRKEIKENVDSPYYGGMEDTAETLMDLLYSKKAELLFSATEDRGGRWTKWEIKVIKLTVDNNTAYFKIEKEIGATERQSDGNTIVKEVKPKEITTIKYIDVN